MGLVALGAPPAIAAAPVIVVSGATITVTGTTANDSLVIDTACTPAAGNSCVRFRMTVAQTPGAGCTPTTASAVVTCTVVGRATVNVGLGAGNDTYVTEDSPASLKARFVKISVDGGPGDDLLYGAGPTEYLYGRDGNDRIFPDAAASSLNVGYDYLSGGPGVDSVDYRSSAGRLTSGVTITLDGVNNDGTAVAGDVDNVSSDIESFYLTPAADGFTGNDYAQIVYAVEGDDVVSTAGGNDTVDTGVGLDRVDGGAGDDSVAGGAGDDQVDGGPGLDKIWGDSTDPAAVGNDVVLSRDQEADVVACGPGSDRVEADAVDLIVDACEAVAVENSGPSLSAVLEITNRILDANGRRKKATLKIACSGGLPCAGTVVVKTSKGKSRRLVGKKRLGKASYAVAPNSAGTVKVKLNKSARRVLRKTRKATVAVTLTIAATRATVRAKVKLKR